MKRLESSSGGFGEQPNLWDTYLSLSILSSLGRLDASPATKTFLERLQVPSFGFIMTPDTSMSTIEVLYAGASCCSLLGIPLAHAADTVSAVLRCQMGDGGFARAPVALPNLELTHLALEAAVLIARGVVSG